MKNIEFRILHSLAINTAKNETFQKGIVDKAVKPELINAAFHEQAGNEAYHEAMLQRYLFSQIEKLKTYFTQYLTGGGSISEDATIDSSERNGYTEIVLSVSDRFNNGLVKTLARLSQKYVEDRMIHLWWASVSKEFSAIYAGMAEDDLAGIQGCFTKTAPEPPVYNFPTAIKIRYPIIRTREDAPGYITPDNSAVIRPEQLLANPWIISRGDETEISYVLSGENGENPIDDIIVRCDNGCCQPFLSSEGRWCIRGCSLGFTIVTLYSRHNDRVFNSFAIRVT